MGYVTVNFLGKEYQISEAVKEFLQYDELLTPIRAKILKQLSQDIKRDSRDLTFGSHVPEYVNNVAKGYLKLIEECADVLVNKLFSLGIYDVTSDTLLSNTTVTADIGNLTMKVLRDMVADGQKYVDMKNQGIESAYRSAASNITGSGVMVFSSSITTLMIHSFVERGILMSQAKQADREYNEAIRAINANTRNALDKMVRETIIKQYYPSLMDILVKFDLKINSAFLVELVQHNKFDFESVQNYDMQKAEQMLINIHRVPDKIAFLQQVFEVCPFSLDLYEACLKQGVLDMDTFKTAEYMGFADSLAEKMEEFIQTHLQSKEMVEPIISILAMYKNTDETTIWQSVYKDTISQIEATYRKYKRALSDKSVLDSFVRRKISVRTIDVAKKSEEEVKTFVNRAVSAVISDARYTEFVAMGVLSPQMLRLENSDSTDLKEINAEISDRLVSAVMAYIDEANRRLTVYQKSKAQFDDEMAVMQDKLNQLRTEKEQLGFFAFSKKKELSSIIENMEKQISEFEQKHESKKLFADFERMYK